jgi:hypothetical protein
MIMSRVGRASRPHLRRLAVVPLAIAVALAVAACGGGGHAPKKTAAVEAHPGALVSQSFSASDAVNSGQVCADARHSRSTASRQLDGKPIALTSAAPSSATAAASSRPTST